MLNRHITDSEGMGGMGLAYVPLTFPTATVQSRMELTGQHVSFGEIDQMWEVYKVGTIRDKNPYYKKGASTNLAIIKYIEAKGFPREKVVSFLNATEFAALDAGWGVRWLNPTEENLMTVQGVANSVAAAAKPAVDVVLPMVKWVVIGVIVAGGAYLVWEGSKLIKRKKGRK